MKYPAVISFLQSFHLKKQNNNGYAAKLMIEGKTCKPTKPNTITCDVENSE